MTDMSNKTLRQTIQELQSDDKAMCKSYLEKGGNKSSLRKALIADGKIKRTTARSWFQILDDYPDIFDPESL